MRKLLVTIATSEIKAIAEPFLANQRAYAARNNYEYRVIETLYWKDLAASFSKVHEIDRALKEGFDYVVWTDLDVVFLKMSFDLKDIIESKLADRPELFMTGKQQLSWVKWKYICMGLTCWRNTEDARNFVTEWKDRCERGCPSWIPGKRTKIIDHPWEQWNSDMLCRETQYHGIYAANAKEIGSFCPEIWSDGDLVENPVTMHYAGQGASWQKKVDIFKRKYANQVC